MRTPSRTFVRRSPGETPPAPAPDERPYLVPGQALAVELHVDDTAAAARWFQRWGFAVCRSSPAFVVLERGGQQLFLGRRPASRPAAVGGSTGELRVVVPDAAAERGQVRGEDVVVLELHRAAYGLVEFVIESPFGIDLRVATPAGAYDVVTS